MLTYALIVAKKIETDQEEVLLKILVGLNNKLACFISYQEYVSFMKNNNLTLFSTALRVQILLPSELWAILK